jgi:hypothetical protein
MAECKTCGAFTKYINGYCYPCYIKTEPSKKLENKADYKASEGEEYIIDFLKCYEIKQDFQVRIDNLKGDTASFRVADFYLPKYGLYIEFLGQWNVPEQQERYKFKKELYFKNRIPCVYLYPENLGILQFVLDKRIQDVLEKNGKNKELRKYRLWKRREGAFERILLIVFFLFLLIIAFTNYKIHPENNNIMAARIFLAVAIIHNGVIFFKAFINIFKKNNYPLNKLD